MLENIKQMILEKKEYLEASQLIFEGTVESDLDDLIVLNEDSNYNEGVIDKIKDFFSSKPDPEVVAKFYKDGNVNYSTKLTREDCKKLHIRGEAKDLVNSIFDYMDDLTLDQLLKLIAVGMQEDGKYDGRIIGNQTNSSNHLGIACKKIGDNFILFDYPSNDKKYSTGCIYINIESKKVYEFSEGDAECKRSNISSLSLPTDKKYEIASSLEKFLNNGFGDEHDSSDKNWQRKLITMFVNPSKEDGLKDTRLESTENHNESVAIGIGAATVTEGFDVSIFDSDDSFFEADDESETSNTEDVTDSDSSAEEGNVTDSEESEDILDTEIPSGEEEPDEAEGETDADGGLLDTPVDDGSMDSIADYGAGDSSFDNEPTELSDDDILSVTIDLKSNTMTDVLPIPPDNAGEAVNDDILSTRVDSGFDETDIQSEPPAVQTESSNSFLEGITLGGDGDSSTDSSDEDNESAPDEEPADENEVTSAVKDKVAEAESEEEPLVDDGEDLGGGDSSAKEALMKKLSSITKSLEDAKNAVLKSL